MVLAATTATMLVGCSSNQSITINNGLDESIVVEVATAHPGKLEISSPLNRREFVATVNAGEAWKSSQAEKSERVDLPPHMANAGVLARFRTWGGEPRAYFVGTRDDVVIRVEPDVNRRYRVLTVGADGVPVEIEESQADWFYRD